MIIFYSAILLSSYQAVCFQKVEEFLGSHTHNSFLTNSVVSHTKHIFFAFICHSGLSLQNLVRGFLHLVHAIMLLEVITRCPDTTFLQTYGAAWRTSFMS